MTRTVRDIQDALLTLSMWANEDCPGEWVTFVRGVVEALEAVLANRERGE